MKDNHHTYYEEFLSSTECKELSELALREEPRVMGIDNPYSCLLYTSDAADE